jgi:hypothetical protein
MAGEDLALAEATPAYETPDFGSGYVNLDLVNPIGLQSVVEKP